MSGDTAVSMITSHTNAAELRKIKKPLIEKRRRDRMNKCLDELKELVVTSCSDESVRSAKMEKADILERTVVHLRLLHQKIGNFQTTANTQTKNINNNDIKNDIFNIKNNKIKANLCNNSLNTREESLNVTSDNNHVVEKEDSKESLNSNHGLEDSLSKQLNTTTQQQQLQHQRLLEEASYKRGFKKCIENVDSYFMKLENSRDSNIIFKSSLIGYLNFFALQLDSKFQMESQIFEAYEDGLSEKSTSSVKQNNTPFEDASRCDDNNNLVSSTQQPQQQHFTLLNHQLNSNSFPTKPYAALQIITNTSNNTNNVSCNNRNNVLHNRKYEKSTRSRKSHYTDNYFNCEDENEVPLKTCKLETPSPILSYLHTPKGMQQTTQFCYSKNNSQKLSDSEISYESVNNNLQNTEHSSTSSCEGSYNIKSLIRQDHHQDKLSSNYLACQPNPGQRCRPDFNLSSFQKNRIISSLAFWRPWRGLII